MPHAMDQYLVTTLSDIPMSRNGPRRNQRVNFLHQPAGLCQRHDHALPMLEIVMAPPLQDYSASATIQLDTAQENAYR